MRIVPTVPSNQLVAIVVVGVLMSVRAAAVDWDEVSNTMVRSANLLPLVYCTSMLRADGNTSSSRRTKSLALKRYHSTDSSNCARSTLFSREGGGTGGS